MVSDFKELDFASDETPEQWDAKIQEKLGISLADMKSALSQYVKDKAEKLSSTFINIAPFGDYGLLMEDHEEMVKFLRTEVCKPEYWTVESAYTNPDSPSLLQFTFCCTVIDDGDTFKGHVYVSKTGIIRHAFAQAN